MIRLIANGFIAIGLVILAVVVLRRLVERKYLTRNEAIGVGFALLGVGLTGSAWLIGHGVI